MQDFDFRSADPSVETHSRPLLEQNKRETMSAVFSEIERSGRAAKVDRQHMTIGQRAMATAMVYLKPKCGRGNIRPANGAESASFRRSRF